MVVICTTWQNLYQVTLKYRCVYPWRIAPTTKEWQRNLRMFSYYTNSNIISRNILKPFSINHCLISNLHAVNQIQPTTLFFFCKVSLKHSHTRLFIFLPVSAFKLQWQILIVVTETMYAKPQIYTTWPFTKKFHYPCTGLILYISTLAPSLWTLGIICY